MKKLYEVKVVEDDSLWTDVFFVLAESFQEAESKSRKKLLKENGRGFSVEAIKDLGDFVA